MNWRLVSLTPALLVLSACEEVEQIVDHYRDLTPHEAYAESLREAGLGETALARDWLEASRRAVEAPLTIELPFREQGFIAPEDADAVGYRFRLERGQRLTVRLQVQSDDSTQVFLDFFRAPADSTDVVRPVTTADTLEDGLVYEPYRAGEYLVRVQPELLRGGSYILTLTLDPALSFPVQDRDVSAIQSFFGAERDGGARDHHGVDIFAPRGTPALAAADGVIRRANITNIGGKVVWIRDERRDRNLYYAHLDSQTVARGDQVRVGDTVGFVGNTGNARTTPPHLHFGLYSGGPTDPLPFLRRPPGRLAELTVDLGALGGWVRVANDGVNVRSSPSLGAEVAGELEGFAPLRVLGGSGEWYRVRLPDARTGWVAARIVEPVDEPIGHAVADARGTMLRARPDPASPVVESISAGTDLPVLGRFSGYVLVQGPGLRRGWMAAGDD
jgi:murein DD-endopeptidase MepM/ murein hydrolase activator NlpD